MRRQRGYQLESYLTYLRLLEQVNADKRQFSISLKQSVTGNHTGAYLGSLLKSLDLAAQIKYVALVKAHLPVVTLSSAASMLSQDMLEASCFRIPHRLLFQGIQAAIKSVLHISNSSTVNIIAC